ERAQQQPENAIAPHEAELGEGVPGGDVQRHRHECRCTGQEYTVREVAAHTAVAKELAVVADRRVTGQQGWREGTCLARRHQRDRDHPQQWKERDGGGSKQEPVYQELRQDGLHGWFARSAQRSCIAVTPKMSSASRNATADAEPRFHHLNPSSYMR